MAKEESVSPPGSFDEWSLLEFIKGRKRAIVALIVTGLTYWITDQELAALIAGLLFEGAFSVLDFYLSKVKLKA